MPILIKSFHFQKHFQSVGDVQKKMFDQPKENVQKAKPSVLDRFNPDAKKKKTKWCKASFWSDKENLQYNILCKVP